MELKYLQLPDSLQNLQELSIPLDYFNGEIEKLFTGYGWGLASWSAGDILRKELKTNVRITHAFDLYASEWNAPADTCPHNNTQKFGHTSFEGRSCDYDAVTAMQELFQSEAPNDIKNEISRRIFQRVDSILSGTNGQNLPLIGSQKEVFFDNGMQEEMDLIIQTLRILSKNLDLKNSKENEYTSLRILLIEKLYSKVSDLWIKNFGIELYSNKLKTIERVSGINIPSILFGELSMNDQKNLKEIYKIDEFVLFDI